MYFTLHSQLTTAQCPVPVVSSGCIDFLLFFFQPSSCQQVAIWMASILAKLPPPPLFVSGKQPLLSTVKKVTVSGIGGRKGQFALVVKAMSDPSESSTSLVKSVQSAWEKSEDRIALIGLGFAAIAGLWATINLVSAIDKLPVIPSLLELVGILFSSWFIYRYLLFKPDREEWFRSVKKSISDILGQ